MHAGENSVKSFLASQRQVVNDLHRRGAGGFETCSAMASVMDEALGMAFSLLSPESRQRIAIVALGGYGRGELFPHSDLDLMILCPSGKDREPASADARTLLHYLWDAGLDIGHSVRTIDEVQGLHGTSLDSWASMLESRFLIGKKELWESFHERMVGIVGGGHDPWLLAGVFGDAQSRHERYGNSVKLLEPNIKKSAGGLRDVHNILWLFRGTRPGYLDPGPGGTTSTEAFLARLVRDRELEEDDHAQVLEALRFLFRVRHEMHYLQASLHDTLEYTLQLHVAEGLGYGSSEETGPSGMRGVERFMRDYYLHARIVYLFHQRMGREFREALDSGRPRLSAGTTLGNGFVLYPEMLSVDSSVRDFDEPRKILDAFALASEHGVDLDFRLRAVIERSGGLIGEQQRSSPPLASAFHRILVSGRVAPTIHAMSDLGILGRYIPEFGDLVAFFQHNVYHYYTADEHTLVAVARAEALQSEQGTLQDVFDRLQRRDVLYLAILLHDIGKPHGVADHEVTGIEIARTVLHRLGMDEIFPDVSFLVRHHLLMEQIAFRRNVHDPQTIKEFVAHFQRPEQLDYLYVLTYADLSAVNTGVWTAWKAVMLQELYQRGSEVLHRHLHGEEIDLLHQSRHEAAADRVVESLSAAIPREHVERHLLGMHNEAYVGLFSEEEIARHIVSSKLEESVVTHFSDAEGYSEVTVIARDAPFALSKFCAVFSANDVNILDANIFTRDDGIIIDRFRVIAGGPGRHLEQDVCTKIREDLRKVMEGTLDIEHLFADHQRRWKRRPKAPPNQNIQTDVEFEDNPKFTIIDVYAPDAVGFLYRVTETISRLGLDIYFAKIATRVDGIVDAFYVLDRDGKQLKGRARRGAIKNEILATLRTIAEEELA